MAGWDRLVWGRSARLEDRVEFGLLGPLVVRASGSRVTVSAGKQRVLLAALLLRGNQVVPAADLTRFVWEGGPPGTARVTLQNYVKRLRQALGPAGYERIVTRPAGYLIEVGAGELDVAQFGVLQAAGQAAARAGAWERASAQLSEALALWRGPPLADVPSQVLAMSEVPRLTEMRLDALEARIDADLHLGRHHEAVPELQSLAATEPLRERLHELLMLALFRSGQQAAALAAYRTARRQLVDELGIEPGPVLRDLNQKILLSDSALLFAPLSSNGAGAGAGNWSGRPAVNGHAAPRPAPPGSAGDPGAERTAAGPGDDAAGDQDAGISADDAPAPLNSIRPSLLPAAVPGFTGRLPELRALSAAADRPGRPVVITVIGGTGGVGKTALAVHWARQVAADFPDGQLYVNLRGFGPADPVSPTEALRAFLDALQVPAAQIPSSLDGRHALYRSLVEGKRILVLLDNAREPAQVRPLLPASPTALVVITSRAEMASLVVTDGAGQISLDILTDADAHQLIAGRIGAPRLAAEPDAADELIRLCAGLPLALAITAARAAAHPRFTLAALAAELRDARGRLDALSTGEDATDVRAVFSWSYQNLQPPAARMFRLLGLHPGPDIAAPAAASLAGLPLPLARRLLRELTRGHLLAEPSPGRYAFHDLLRAYAAERAVSTDSMTARRAAMHRVLDHYLHTAHAAAVLINPGRDTIDLPPVQAGAVPETFGSHVDALAWFEAEHQVLLTAAAMAAESGFDVHAWQLPWTLVDHLEFHGLWHDIAAIQDVALAAAERLGDLTAQANVHRSVGRVRFQLSAWDDARSHLSQALRLYKELGDGNGQARVHLTVGKAMERMGRLDEALGHARQALTLFEEADNRQGQARALNNIGWYHAMIGDHRQALMRSWQALGLQRELGDRCGEANTWDTLGYSHQHLGQLAKSASCFQKAVRLFADMGSRSGEAEVLTHLGEVHRVAGSRQAAVAVWRQALTILDELEHPGADELRGKLRQLAGTDGRATLTQVKNA
ncbi:MAG TPA: BTAD domain-containing putative transcriptional regulator [Streptosporangiaceae bacterium]|nr:BTAD domain-containing putative transcriptional regulator [Streptosporangiaceae bacterium]